VIVREAGPGDAKAVIGLVSELIVELGGQPLPMSATTDAYLELLNSSPRKGFVMFAETGGVAVAVCTVSHVHALRSTGQYSIIQEMYVRPEVRSTGVGAQLLERALREAVFRGSRFVELGTPFEGERQIAFYRRSGFVVVGERLRRTPATRE
jgi:GNAT superfamily N-acetyltransferase